MKPKALILMGVAITCGLGASYMTSRLLAQRGGEDSEQVTVLVAKKALPVGEMLKKPDEWFVEKNFSKGQEPVGAFDLASLDVLKNKTMKRSLRAGDHITPADIVSDKDQFMDPPTGYRAVGIRVDAESGVAGWASLPLSRVDIIHTVRKADEKTTYSQVILENVLVLAADANVNRPENGQATPAQIVTVALKPEDVLKVTLAGETGKMRLMLRKMSDGSKIENVRLTAEQLRTGDTTEEATEQLPAPAVIPTPPVVVAEQPKPAPKVVEVVEELPRGDRHVLKIIDGDSVRLQEYLLDKEKNVIAPIINKSDLAPPRPQAAPRTSPAATAPASQPAPAAQPKAAPAPKNDDNYSRCTRTRSSAAATTKAQGQPSLGMQIPRAAALGF